MAEDKKGFLLYADFKELFEEITNEEAGLLIKHIFKYVNDENPISDNAIVRASFIPIKLQLKRDLEKWDKSKDEKSINGRVGNLKRWNLDLFNQLTNKELTLEEAENVATCRKASLPDKTVSQRVAKIAVNDNVNVTVNVKDIKEVLSVRKVNFSESLKPFLEKYSKDMLNNFYLYWTEHGEKDKKMRYEKERTFGLSQRLATWYKNDYSPKSQSKIDNPYNLSPAQLESNRISKLQLDEAIRLKKLGNDSK